MSKASDDDVCEYIEDEVVAHTTALSDSDSVYSYDTDAEYDDRMESIYKESNEISVAPVDNVFPISSYTSLRFHLNQYGVGEDGTVAYVQCISFKQSTWNKNHKKWSS